MTIKINWTSDNINDTFNVYRSAENISPLNPPEPIAVGISDTEFIDTHAHVDGAPYNYRVAKTRNGKIRPEWMSEQKSYLNNNASLYFDFLSGTYMGSTPSVTRNSTILMADANEDFQEFLINQMARLDGIGAQVVPQSTRITHYPATPQTNWSTASAIKTLYPGTYLGQFTNAARAASTGASWHRLIVTPIMLSWTSGQLLSFSFFYTPGSSGRRRIVLRDNTANTESIITGVIGGAVTITSAAGVISNFKEIEVKPGIFRATGTFTPMDTIDTGALAIGPDSDVSGEDIIVYGGWLENTAFATPPNLTTPATQSVRSGDILSAPVPDGGRAFALAVDIKGRDANGRWLVQWSNGSSGNRYTVIINPLGTHFSLDVASGGGYIGSTGFDANGPIIGRHFISGVVRGGYVYAADLGAAEPSPSNRIAPVGINLLGLGGSGLSTATNSFAVIEKFCEADISQFASSAEARAWAKSVAESWS